MNVEKIILGIQTCSASVSGKLSSLICDTTPAGFDLSSLCLFQLVTVTLRELSIHHVTLRLVSASVGSESPVSSVMSAPQDTSQSSRHATSATPAPLYGLKT